MVPRPAARPHLASPASPGWGNAGLHISRSSCSGTGRSESERIWESSETLLEAVTSRRSATTAGSSTTEDTSSSDLRERGRVA